MNLQKTLNDWGEQRTPFVFILDYEKKKCTKIYKISAQAQRYKSDSNIRWIGIRRIAVV